MEEVTPKDLFLESLARCAHSEKFIPAFYDRFVSVSDEIREKFQHTNFEQQNQMLLQSLSLVAAAAVGEQEGLKELRERATTHDRYHLNIKPELYDLWRSALIETSREFDDKWNNTIEDAWDRILGHVINHMIKNY